MNRYETVFIITPVLSDDQVAETVDKFRKFLKGKGAVSKFEDHWGLRKLAYPIQKKTTGFYQLFEYEAKGDVVNLLEVEFSRDERILRFLTTKMEKYHLLYAESRRAKGREQNEQPAQTRTEARAEA
ncbi:MAG: 30S ribosomal protein S6 [Flavobacteriales bacterium]|nr:30S ribosomal protein S6 [Flavobacteriales bacterium]